MSTDPAILQVENLTVAYCQEDTWHNAIQNIFLTIHPGQIYGLVGESGSGKSTLAMAIMRYLGEDARIVSGKVLLDGDNLLELDDTEIRRVWGKGISLVPQNPSASLNPTMKVGEQIAEVLRRHEGIDRKESTRRTVDLLKTVQIADPERVAKTFPHQLSGGMQQRILIAMAISTNPRILILDEPTTGLDVTTQSSILVLIKNIIHDSQTAVLYITHNLGVAAHICDRIAVLYAGDLVEDRNIFELFNQPLHPYTHGLLDSQPRLGESKDKGLLRMIPGVIPPLGMRSTGCVFIDRCPLALDICEIHPDLSQINLVSRVRCHRWQEIAGQQIEVLYPQAAAKEQSREPNLKISNRWDNNDVLLRLEDVWVSFAIERTFFEWLTNRPVKNLVVVKDVGFVIPKAVTLGLVGESGSGKSTLARSIAGLVERTDGEMELLKIPLPPQLADRNLDFLKHIQMIFQDPDEALNPHRTVRESLRRPFITIKKMPGKQADLEVIRLLELVRLPAQYANRKPAQLSGGEKQRVAIARAFAPNPDLLLADEPLSSLDASVQAYILNLLIDLQNRFGTSVLLISHDLAVVGYVADIIAVIYLGQLMEIGRADLLFKPPYHPYTEVLLAASPSPEPSQWQTSNQLKGELPSLAQRPTGSPFHTRCPRFLGDICIEQTPPWQKGPDGLKVFCHIPLEKLAADQRING